MYTTRSEFPQRRSTYTAKTMNMSAGDVAQAREDEALDWGTMDQAPARAAQPSGRNPMLDWGIAIGLLGILAGATGIAAMTIVAAGTAVVIKTNPDVAAASIASLRGPATTQEVVPLPVEPTAPAVAATAAPAAAPPARKAPARPRARKSTRPAPTRAPVAPTPAPTRTQAAPVAAPAAPTTPKSAPYGSMSLNQLKGYLTETPAPAPVAAPPAPAPVAAPVDDDLDALIAEPIPAASPVSSAMAARSSGTSRPAPAPAAPAVSSTAGYKQLSTRLAKAPNGVLVLDEPFDPVPVAITTDDSAAVYVDGELLGGAPIAVVVDRGSHEVTIQAEKGTVAFDLDASEGSKWCFSVKRGPKLGTCR